jgi:hypothetical protein
MSKPSNQLALDSGTPTASGKKKQNLAAILINLGQTLTKTGSFSVRSEHIMPFYAYCQRKTFNDAFYHRNNGLTEMGLTGTGTEYLTLLLL